MTTPTSLDLFGIAVRVLWTATAALPLVLGLAIAARESLAARRRKPRFHAAAFRRGSGDLAVPSGRPQPRRFAPSRPVALSAAVLLLAAAVPAGAGKAPTDVNVVNQPSVVIDDSVPISVREADPAGGAFQVERFESATEGMQAFGTDLATVPAGKRLVIEQISALVSTEAGQRAVLSIRTCAGAPDAVQCADHWVPLTAQGHLNGYDRFVAGQTVRIHADPGSVVSFGVNRFPTEGSSIAQVTIAGRLVDAP